MEKALLISKLYLDGYNHILWIIGFICLILILLLSIKSREPIEALFPIVVGVVFGKLTDDYVSFLESVKWSEATVRNWWYIGLFASNFVGILLLRNLPPLFGFNVEVVGRIVMNIMAFKAVCHIIRWYQRIIFESDAGGVIYSFSIVLANTGGTFLIAALCIVAAINNLKARTC